MKKRFLPTVESVAHAVRGGRVAAGLTQAELASKAHVGRGFIIELEAGHPRAELAKVLQVLEALDIHAMALPSVSSGRTFQDIDLDEAMARFE